MNRKAKGSRAERRTVRLLEEQGFICTKAGGSLGLFDVVAVGPESVRLVQVKSGEARLSRQERIAILAVRVPGNVTREYWRYPDYAPGPTIEVLD